MGYIGNRPTAVPLTSADIQDGVITAADLGANSVDSSELVDGSIDTSHLADNQVTLAKMAGLARGKLIYGDASGDPAALAVGGADEVLTHDGTDFDWAAAGGTPVHYFDAHLPSYTSLTDEVDTKVTGMTENEDSSGWWASDRFTPLLAGRYYIMGTARLSTESGSSYWHHGKCTIQRNGVVVADAAYNSYASYAGQMKQCTTSVIVNMNGSSDYIELYVTMDVTEGSPACIGTGAGETRICGFYIGA